MPYPNPIRKLATTVTVLLMAAVAAPPSTAIDGGAPAVDEPTGTDQAFLVINLGVLGDTGISCDDTDDADTCLGGATGPFDSTATAWRVKAVDYGANGMEGTRMDLPSPGVDENGFELDVAFIARVQATYTSAIPAVETCTVGEPSPADACDYEDDVVLFKNTHVMPGCGEAGTAVDGSEFDPHPDYDPIEDVELKVMVFWDGPVFFAFDCLFGGSGSGSTCAAAELPDRIPIVGIFGETGWDYVESTYCDQSHVNDAGWNVAENKSKKPKPPPPFDTPHNDGVADAGGGDRKVEIDRKPGATGFRIQNLKGDEIRVRWLNAADQEIESDTFEQGQGTSGSWPQGATKMVVETTGSGTLFSPKKAAIEYEQFK